LKHQEIIPWGLDKEILDCTVAVCDGAGSVIVRSPKPVQDTVMNGLLKTYSIVEVVDAIEKLCGIVLDRNEATIDQVNGF
jgi:hypothetical protein